VGFAPAKLGGHVEHGRGFGLDARQAANDLGGQGGEILGQVGALEKLLGFLVNVRGLPGLHLIQMHGKFGGIQRFAFPQIFAGINNGIPGFERHKILLFNRSLV
jgi:hypothetical protein